MGDTNTMSQIIDYKTRRTSTREETLLTVGGLLNVQEDSPALPNSTSNRFLFFRRTKRSLLVRSITICERYL